MQISGQFNHEDIRGFAFGYHPFARPKMIAHLYFADGLRIDAGQHKMRKAVLRIFSNDST